MYKYLRVYIAYITFTWKVIAYWTIIFWIRWAFLISIWGDRTTLFNIIHSTKGNRSGCYIRTPYDACIIVELFIFNQHSPFDEMFSPFHLKKLQLVNIYMYISVLDNILNFFISIIEYLWYALHCLGIVQIERLDCSLWLGSHSLQLIFWLVEIRLRIAEQCIHLPLHVPFVFHNFTIINISK